MSELRERKLHFDLLRILAAFSVVMLHSAAQFWYELDVRSTEWVISNSYNAAFRFGVPIFVMISGAMFLDKNYQLDVKRLFRNNIFRLAMIYIIWSCIYGLYDCSNFGWEVLGAKDILREMISGRYHLWFLPMLIGIYVLLPVLKRWVEHAEKKELQYFLMLFFLLQICGETVKTLTVTDELEYLIDLGKVEMVCGYIGYFVLGYYLTHIGVSKKMCRWFYVLCIPAIISNIVGGTLLIWRDGITTIFYDSYGIFTFIITTALFLYTIEKGKTLSVNEKTSRMIREMSADTLGAYVMHVGLMEYLADRGIHSMSLPNIIGIPLFSLLCFFICMILAALLRRIPVIGRFFC